MGIATHTVELSFFPGTQTFPRAPIKLAGEEGLEPPYAVLETAVLAVGRLS